MPSHKATATPPATATGDNRGFLRGRVTGAASSEGLSLERPSCVASAVTMSRSVDRVIHSPMITKATATASAKWSHVILFVVSHSPGSRIMSKPNRPEAQPHARQRRLGQDSLMPLAVRAAC